jgi:PAS domain S-box-containing protein
LFLGGIFAYFIGKRLTEPVLRLTDGAHRINKGILDQKIEVSSRDELSELANTFNDMASNLDQKIRELVSSKEKTQEAEKYLETLFDSIEDGIIVVNSNHMIIKMNRSFLKKTEREDKDVLGRTCHEIIFGVLPSEDQKEKCPLNSLLESKKSIRFVHEIDSGTEKKILEINASLFLDKKGVQNIIMVIRDVTQHKFIEDQIMLRNRELAALKDFNDDILNNINIAIYVVDTDLKILAVNNELIKLTRGGIRKEKIINNNLINVYPFLKDTNVELEYKHVIKTGEIFLSEEKTQYYGETIYTSTSKIPIKDKNGNIEKIITVIEDISERKKLEEELKDSYGELQLTYSKLQELYKIKDNFLSNISHELRTPLTSVIGYTELMLDEKLTQHQRHMAEIIFRNSKRLSRLIKSLLDSQLIESRNLHLAGEKVVISEIMAEVVEDMKNVAASKNIPIKINMTDTLVVEGDIERLTQVFSNLLDNAIKFTITGEINIRGEMDNQKAHIQISDTGIGIPQDRMEKIFDRFYQVDSSDERKYGGTGLGLWISKNIIEAHGGRIWAESKNSGSTFHILLPKSVKS